MTKLKIVLKMALKVIVIIVLTCGYSWALSSYAKKYGMGCKICHSFGSNLNELGLTFKKNGHNFGENNALQKNKPKQSTLREDKDTNFEAPDKTPDKSGSKTVDPEAATDAPDADQPLAETKVYSWTSDDGIIHFSDAPYVKPRGEKLTAPGKTVKKIGRAGFRPLSAIIPKRLPKTSAQAASPKPNKTLLPASGAPGTTVGPIQTSTDLQPKSFEDCMEQILAANQSPNTSEAAMDLFLEAETICVPYENKRKR